MELLASNYNHLKETQKYYSCNNIIQSSSNPFFSRCFKESMKGQKSHTMLTHSVYKKESEKI